MSKSRGNIVRAEPIREVMGADALRYFLLREVVFGQDGSFSYDALIGRYNSDLANGLGNLASRTLTMIHQYRKGVIPRARKTPSPPLARDRRSRRCSSPSSNFEFSQGPGSRLGADLRGGQVHRGAWRPGNWRRQTDEGSQKQLERHALYRRRSAAHRHRAALARAAGIGRQRSGRSSA